MCANCAPLHSTDTRSYDVSGKVKSMSELVQPFPNLQGHQYTSLTTFRKTGVAVPTPVWFAVSHGRLYVVTLGSSGKAKRIRNNPLVTLAPCTGQGKILGPEVEATARILPADEDGRARVALSNKYGWQFGLFAAYWKLSGKVQDTVFLEIAPDASEL